MTVLFLPPLDAKPHTLQSVVELATLDEDSKDSEDKSVMPPTQSLSIYTVSLCSFGDDKTSLPAEESIQG
jgi:hypothetical protein